MKSMQLTTHVNNNGLLQINLPPEYANQDIDIVLVIQAHHTTEDQDDLKLLQNTRHEETLSFAEYLKNAD
jgi:hypothetical protein